MSRRVRRISRDVGGGYILVAVLSVMLLLTGVVAAGTMVIRSALNTAKVGDDDVAMAGLAESGVEVTGYQLFVLKLPATLVDGRRIRLTGGTVKPTIVDESGKADLNGSDSKLLEAVFLSVGLDSRAAAEITASIAEFRGHKEGADTTAAPGANPGGTPGQPGTDAQSSNQTSTQPSSLGASAQQAGAPQTSPTQAGTQPNPQAPGGQAQKKRRGFQSIDDLRVFPDLTRGDLEALADRLTVYNPDGKINMLTASEAMLSAVPGLTRPKVEDILAHREGATKDDIKNLTSSLGDAGAFLKTDPGSIFSVRVDAVSQKGRKKAIDTVLGSSKSPNTPFYVLDWRD